MSSGTRGRGGVIALFVLLIVGLVMGGVAAQASVIYVDKSAGGSNNGSSWANAYTDLQAALGAAAIGEDIYVAAGIYYPGSTQTSSFDLKNKDGVGLYGGYPTGGGTRDVAANVTALSGDVDHNDTTDANGVTTTIVGGNAYHVVRSTNNHNTAILDGFTITGGNANGSYPDNDNAGGGMFNHFSSPTVTNCTFSGNTAFNGGGMFNFSSSPALTNCTFSGNTASTGGGMFNSSSSPTLTNCTFSGNTASTGGGMYNYFSSSLTLTNCTFSGNTASTTGGGMKNSSSSPTLTNCTFSGNTASTTGGGMFNDSSSFTLTNCTFSNNTAVHGGGMENYVSSTAKIYDTILWGDSGGEIANSSSTPTVADCVVQGGYTGGTNIITADPLLGTLGDYGGNTATIPLLSGSSAIDAAAYPSGVTKPDTDQRGVTRPQGPKCDIGAYEYVSPVGDVNGDGTINILDVRLCLQIAVGVIPGTAAQRAQADMNGDGQVTLVDAQLLADYVIGISS